jgi:hypothetical protein
MNNEISYQVTANQAKALRNFDIPEAKIQALTKKQASDLLTQLIQRARINPKMRLARQKSEEAEPLSEARGNLSDATRIVMEHFGLKDMSDLGDGHIALIQETSRQIYGLRYWIGKPNGYLKPNGD